MAAARPLPIMAEVRLLITRQLHGSIDGIQLERFVPGYVYEVGIELACYFLAEMSAEPVRDDTPAIILPPAKHLFGPLPNDLVRPRPPRRAATYPVRTKAADRSARRRPRKKTGG